LDRSGISGILINNLVRNVVSPAGSTQLLGGNHGRTFGDAEMDHDRATRLREFATRYTAAWCSKDAARVAAFFSPNGSLAINGGAPAVGRSAITEAAQGFMTDFPDLEVTMDGLLFQEQKVIYKWTLSGTNTGSGGTGQRVRISGFEEWQLGSDGLVVESRGHFDGTDYQRQLEHGVDGGQ
jgi:predicted ester cyclase